MFSLNAERASGLRDVTTTGSSVQVAAALRRSLCTTATTSFGALDTAGVDERPRSLTDGADWATAIDECAYERHRLPVHPQAIGIHHAAREQERTSSRGTGRRVRPNASSIDRPTIQQTPGSKRRRRRVLEKRSSAC